MDEHTINSGKTTAITAYITIVGTLIAIFMNLDDKNPYADFSDGTQWGELLLGYDIDAEGSISFQDVAHVIYPLPR